MAGWNNATMTDVGEELQAKVNAGLVELTFTKIKVGSGVSTTNAQALTDVIASKWETTNFTVKRDGKIVTVDTFITNTGITEAFRMAEIGLFARDPDKGEVLYAYLTDSEPDRMPAEGGSTVVSQELSLGMTFSNSGNVTLTVNMGALVTREQLEQHNSDPNAHGGLITKVQSELTRHNTDVSAHPPITAMIAKILGTSNWQENPAATLKDIKNLLGTGGIVAQRLEENGFVKFANGFIIQWGKIQDNTSASRSSYRLKEVTLPLAFSSNWYSILTTQISLFSAPKEELDRLGAIIISTKTVNKFAMQLDDYSAGAYWLCVGA
nr:MAG TPA: tail collar fiber protein [Caudoviricetes sp.]